jgi:glycerophosphoryl diester phosphodiesterase
LATDVKTLVETARCSDNVIVSGFDTDDNDSASSSSWAELESLSPGIRIAPLATRSKMSRLGIESFMDHACRLGATAVHPQWSTQIDHLLPVARSAGLSVHVWTVNDAAEITRLRNIGADAIFTDFPARARS